MSPQAIFQTHLVLGDVGRLLCFGTYVLPRLRSMDRFNAQRVIATIHSFRFFGLVFILPGVVGPNLLAGFAVFAAYGDFATDMLALLALLTVRIRPRFWFFVGAFNGKRASPAFSTVRRYVERSEPSIAVSATSPSPCTKCGSAA